MIYCHFTDLHDELSRVRSSHGGALTSCEDPNGPDVESCGAKETAQYHSLRQTHKHNNNTIKTSLHSPENKHSPTEQQKEDPHKILISEIVALFSVVQYL